MTNQAIAPLDPDMIRLHRRGSGMPLVMLHCLGMSHHLWDCLGGLADRFELVSCDLPGHGETPVPPAPYGIEELSDQLATVLRRNGIVRAHVIGISLGGLIAQHFAATYPAVVDHLVLCDTTPRYTDEARANWVVRAAAARQNGPASLLPAIERIWFTAGFLALDPPPPALRLVRDTFAACPARATRWPAKLWARPTCWTSRRKSTRAPWSCADPRKASPSGRPPTGWRRTSLAPNWPGSRNRPTLRCWNSRAGSRQSYGNSCKGSSGNNRVVWRAPHASWRVLAARQAPGNARGRDACGVPTR